MRSRHWCTGFEQNEVQRMRGEGVPVPPENGFRVKIRLSYLNRDLKFSGFQGAAIENSLFEQRLRFGGRWRRYGCVEHVFLPIIASQDVHGRTVKGLELMVRNCCFRTCVREGYFSASGTARVVAVISVCCACRITQQLLWFI